MVVVLEKMNMVVAASIGLVAESINRHKAQQQNVQQAQQAQQAQQTPQSTQYPVNNQTQDAHHSPEDDQWALDEIQDDVSRISSDSEDNDNDNDQEQGQDQKKKKKEKIRNPAHLADDFLKRYPPPAPGTTSNQLPLPLPLPVIIPQRRPGVRVRGFVRAYAPDLERCGIDQDTFMDFLVTFTRASRAPQWMGAFNLTAAAAFALPGHAMGAGVGFAIQVVNAIAMEMRGRVQANAFLQKLNEGFFQPRGLYCLVLSFDNTHEEAMTEEALAEKIAMSSDPKSGVRKYTDKLRTNSGTTGPAEFPESAPLVFPVLDWMMKENPEQAEKQGRYLKFRKFVADYYDRRAQVEYAARNPTRPLAAAPQRGFTSKFADPNDATNKSPISLATGGAVPYNSQWRGETRNPRGRQRKIADKVLYMIIVNMPTNDDMNRAESIMATESEVELIPDNRNSAADAKD